MGTKILIPIGTTPTGFGIAYTDYDSKEGPGLRPLSPCCNTFLTMHTGTVHSSWSVKCNLCEADYKEFSTKRSVSLSNTLAFFTESEFKSYTEEILLGWLAAVTGYHQDDIKVEVVYP